MTLLKQWRERTGTTQSALAAKTGIDQALLSKYERSCWVPGTRNALLIQQATDNEVPVSSWYTARALKKHKRVA